MSLDDEARRWNVNLQHHRVILDAVPDGCRRALDVGCGEGMLSRQLSGRAEEVIGIDPDAPSLALARERPVPGVQYVEGDVLSHPFESGSFDLIASVAALHHMDPVAGLARMAELLRSGGTLALVGIARPRMPQDLPFALAGSAATTWHWVRGAYWDHSAPMVWPPAHTYPEIRRIAADALPGVSYRHHVLGRYSLRWVRPA